MNIIRIIVRDRYILLQYSIYIYVYILQYSNFYNIAIFIFGKLNVLFAQIFHQSCVTHVRLYSFWSTSNSHHRSNMMKWEVVLPSPIFFPRYYVFLHVIFFLTRYIISIMCVIRDIVSFWNDEALTNINWIDRSEHRISLTAFLPPLSLSLSQIRQP